MFCLSNAFLGYKQLFHYIDRKELLNNIVDLLQENELKLALSQINKFRMHFPDHMNEVINSFYRIAMMHHELVHKDAFELYKILVWNIWGLYEQSLELCNMLLATDKDIRCVVFKLEILNNLERYDEALEFYENSSEVIELYIRDPILLDVEPEILKIQILNNLERYDEATELWRSISKNSFNEQVVLAHRFIEPAVLSLRLIGCSLYVGRRSFSAETYQDILQQMSDIETRYARLLNDSQHVDIWLCRAYMSSKIGLRFDINQNYQSQAICNEEALFYYEKVIKIRAHNFTAWKGYLSTLCNMKKYDELIKKLINCRIFYYCYRSGRI